MLWNTLNIFLCVCFYYLCRLMSIPPPLDGDWSRSLMDLSNARSKIKYCLLQYCSPTLFEKGDDMRSRNTAEREVNSKAGSYDTKESSLELHCRIRHWIQVLLMKYASSVLGLKGDDGIISNTCSEHSAQNIRYNTQRKTKSPLQTQRFQARFEEITGLSIIRTDFLCVETNGSSQYLGTPGQKQEH